MALRATALLIREQARPAAAKGKARGGWAQIPDKRPVVAFDVDLDGEQFDGVEFTLADRADMNFVALVGRNLIELADKLVDVTA